MKKLGLMVVGAFIALGTTSAMAQTVKTTSTRTSTQTSSTTPIVRKNGNVVIDGQVVKQKPGVPQQRPGTASQAGQQYSTSPRDPVNTYSEQVNNDRQGASADNDEETVTITTKETEQAKTTTPTKSMNNKPAKPSHTSSRKVVRP